MKKLSSGYLKDLIVVNLCFAMLHVSQDIEEKDIGKENLDENIKRRNAIKGIDNEALYSFISTLRDDLRDYLRIDAHIPYLPDIKKKTDKYIARFMPKVRTKPLINLDLLAIWILYYNFVNQDRYIDKYFDELKDENRYKFILDVYKDNKVFTIMERLEIQNIAREILMEK